MTYMLLLVAPDPMLAKTMPDVAQRKLLSGTGTLAANCCVVATGVGLPVDGGSCSQQHYYVPVCCDGSDSVSQCYPLNADSAVSCDLNVEANFKGCCPADF